MINTVVWRHGQHPERITAFCAVSTAGSRYSDARYAAFGTAPGSDAWVRANDLRTTLDDRRVAHLLLMQDPSRPPGNTISPDDIQRSGPCTVEASQRWRPYRVAEQARRAAEHAAWLEDRRRTDPTSHLERHASSGRLTPSSARARGSARPGDTSTPSPREPRVPEQQTDPDERYGFVVTYAHGGDEEFWFETEHDRDSQIGHYGPETGCTTRRVTR